MSSNLDVTLSIQVQHENAQRFALMAIHIGVDLRAIEVTQKKLHIQIRGCTPTINESSWRLAEDVFISRHRPI